MATMPTIDYGSRQLAVPGNVQMPNFSRPRDGAVWFYEQQGRAIGGALDSAARALYHIADIKDMADRRDAEFAMRQAENWFDSQWYGTDSVDPQTGAKKHTPGVADRNFMAFEADGTDAMKECNRLKKEFRETDIYKNLSGGSKAHFERQLSIYEGRLDNIAAEQHRKVMADKIRVQTEDKIEWTTDKVQRAFGDNDVNFENSAAWGATQITAVSLGSLVENSDEIAVIPNARIKDMVFRGGKRFEQLAPAEQKYVKDIYEKSLNSYRKNRIKALADAASTGSGLGTMTPEQCLDKALEMTFVMNGAGAGFDPKTGAKNPGKDGNPLKANMTDIDRNEFVKYIEGAAQGLDRHRKIAQGRNAQALEEDFRKNALDGTEDTNVLLGKKFDKVGYAQKLAGLIQSKAIDEKTAVTIQSQYNQLADRQEYVRRCIDIYNRTGKGGVWTRARGRDGKEIDVFQPDRLGNGKTETDPTIAAKYTMKDRNGNTPYFNNPAAGMEDLDFDLRMGNISVPFYNAQMAALRVYSDTKAKTAFVKIFGADATLFPDKDLPQYQKQGIDTAHKQLWAKNQWWNGDRKIGKNNVTWQKDALNGDGGEYKVNLEQEAQICEMVLQLTAEGVDPTDAIQSYLAPTFDGWMKTDLSERLDPSKKIGGKTFRDWILESKRFGSAVGPRDREARLQARQKQAYEAK